MKKIFFLVIFILSFQNLSLSKDIQYFQIEGMKIGDSALDYFKESELEDNEQGWHNYSYKEYSTSLMPGKGIYDWFLISYRNGDNNFIIEAIAGGIEKINYNKKECVDNIDSSALKISDNLKMPVNLKKKTYELAKDASRNYPFTGKSEVTSLSFNFIDGAEIILACYIMNKEAKQNESLLTLISNKKDTFRTEVQSHTFRNFLKKGKAE
tara:strand:+ start:686 stop:1315 length:630 start_codon:yes stop_codon:yes gene_type:complete